MYNSHRTRVDRRRVVDVVKSASNAFLSLGVCDLAK